MYFESIYLIKINIAFIVCYLFYRLLFSKDTFFNLRRIFLSGFLIFGFVYPFFIFQEWFTQQHIVMELAPAYTAFIPDVITEATPAQTIVRTPIFPVVIKVLYLTGVCVLTLRFLIQLVSVLRLRLGSQKQKAGDITIYVPEKDCEPFSFLHWIFIHPEKYSPEELQQILVHESAHTAQWHSIDILLSEFACIVCWFNPFCWLLNREIRHNLEYLADDRVLKEGYDTRNYQYHLLALAYHSGVTIYNHFNIHLKKRIGMMNQKRTNAISSIKYLLVVPFILALLVFNNIDSVAKTGSSLQLAGLSDLPVIYLNEIVVTAYGKPSLENQEKNFAKSEEELELLSESSQMEQRPVYPGGDEEILRHFAKAIKYPASAQENGRQGRLLVTFIINEDGKISDAEIAKGIDTALDKEALRVVELLSSSIWEPGKQDGKNVKVRCSLPIVFRLQ